MRTESSEYPRYPEPSVSKRTRVLDALGDGRLIWNELAGAGVAPYRIVIQDESEPNYRGSIPADEFVAELEKEGWDFTEERKALALELSGRERASLRTLRLKVGLSQAQLATRIGNSQAAVARLESGKGNPELKTIRALADALGVDAGTVANALG